MLTALGSIPLSHDGRGFSARRTAGATYGNKGKTTKDSFVTAAKTKAGVSTVAVDQRKAVIEVLKADLKRDVDAMKSVCAPGSPHWKDLKEKVTDKKDQEALIGEVSKRIIKGEEEVAIRISIL